MHAKAVKLIIFIHLTLLFFTLSIAWGLQGENAMAVRSLCAINNFSFLFRLGDWRSIRFIPRKKDKSEYRNFEEDTQIITQMAT